MCVKHPGSPHIFCKEDGSPIGDVKKSFSTALKRAGIKQGIKDGGVTFHTLRHTFCFTFSHVRIRFKYRERINGS